MRVRERPSEGHLRSGAPDHLKTRDRTLGPLWAAHEQPVADLPTFGAECRFTATYPT